jgi:hypothetical protein
MKSGRACDTLVLVCHTLAGDTHSAIAMTLQAVVAAALAPLMAASST